MICPTCHTPTDEYTRLKSELKQARSAAAVLAHAYMRDSRPPANVARLALEWLPKGTGE